MDRTEGGGLLVRLDERRAGVPTTAAAVAERWFAQDLFADPDLAMGDDGEGFAEDQEGFAGPALDDGGGGGDGDSGA